MIELVDHYEMMHRVMFSSFWPSFLELIDQNAPPRPFENLLLCFPRVEDKFLEINNALENNINALSNDIVVGLEYLDL